MATEPNGSGRLDRIEASLEELTHKFHLMVGHHEAEFKTLMTWQVLMQDKMDRSRGEADRERRRLDALSEKTDKCIAELVSAVSVFLSTEFSPDF
jgi:hypothetical protein